MNWKLLTKPTGHDENKTSTLPKIKQCTITFENDYCLIKVSERIVIMADTKNNKVTVFRDQKIIHEAIPTHDFIASELFNIIKLGIAADNTLNTFTNE